MEEYQQRVITEKRELDDRLDKLKAFFGEGKFTELYAADQERMREQGVIMTAYSTILGNRIKAFSLYRKEKEMAKYPFDSAKLRETIPEQDMEYEEETDRVLCHAECPHCKQRVSVPFQRIVFCSFCKLTFKLSVT